MTLSISCKGMRKRVIQGSLWPTTSKSQYSILISNMIIFVSNLNFPTFSKKKVMIIQPSTQTFLGLHHWFTGKLQARAIKIASSLSISSDLVRAMHARRRGKAARPAKRGHACGHLRVSRVLLDGLRKQRGRSQFTCNKAKGISVWEDSLYSFTGHILQITGTDHRFIDSLVNQVISLHLKITFWIRIRARTGDASSLVFKITCSMVTCFLTCGM